MNTHTSKRFDEGLSNLQNMMMEMGKLTEQQLTNISLYLQNSTSSTVLEEVNEIDRRVNRYHIDINNEAINLIATRAPVAIDLRFISAIDRISTDLERIGDEICKVARFMLRDDIETSSKLWREIRPTTRLAQNMLYRTLDALARIDVKDAEKIINDDSDLDDNYSGVVRQLITYMMEDARTISQSVDIMFAAKALERVGDHCMNIAEAIIFYDKGEDVRIRE